jgi:hypothetical protein
MRDNTKQPFTNDGLASSDARELHVNTKASKTSTMLKRGSKHPCFVPSGFKNPRCGVCGDSENELIWIKTQLVFASPE